LRRVLLCFILAAICHCGTARAQGNYEIQVYGADTVPKGNMMFELHSNFTASGQQHFIGGVAPTYHAGH
jgi:hypothetical protein